MLPSEDEQQRPVGLLRVERKNLDGRRCLELQEGRGTLREGQEEEEDWGGGRRTRP